MHMAFRVGDTTLLASDGRCLGRPSFEGFALSLTAPDDARAERLFAALADGGQVQMPLGKTFFSPRFGMVADRFGMGWMVIALPPEVAADQVEFVISRVFDAPRDIVWKAWTSPEHIKRWWAPRPYQTPEVDVELRPGGKFHTRMTGPDGFDFSGTACVLEVVPGERKAAFFSGGSLTVCPLAR